MHTSHLCDGRPRLPVVVGAAGAVAKQTYRDLPHRHVLMHTGRM